MTAIDKVQDQKNTPPPPKVPWYSRLLAAVGEVIGQVKFGQ